MYFSIKKNENMQGQKLEESMQNENGVCVFEMVSII